MTDYDMSPNWIVFAVFVGIVAVLSVVTWEVAGWLAGLVRLRWGGAP